MYSSVNARISLSSMALLSIDGLPQAQRTFINVDKARDFKRDGASSVDQACDEPNKHLQNDHAQRAAVMAAYQLYQAQP